MEASSILFRCSSLGHIMTEPRGKGEGLSETTKNHLVDKFVSVKYGRNTDIFTKYTTKGLKVEDDSITLYSRLTKEFYTKNEETISNEWISGTPDLYKGEEITKATHIIDIKSSWDIFTFFRTKNKELNKMYYWQLQGYMWLTGAETATLAYCLVNTPDTMIQDEKRRIAWKMGLIDDVDQDYIQACEEIDKLSIYDDIQLIERVNSIAVYRNDDDIEKLKTRIELCRTWMEQNLL